ncbi:hypothetical protein DFP72DRAFT_863878 [Ephemerocybe angulata]|uniref:Uncharacterized protein n=1 Tax=Ephemerocybe angulata TaxID=980116 RepID=A0A8H6H6M1_9AGAR|nr:hypothetical protein DFP72DRAFT_863878 [Tulosesus angulatus]
MSATLHPTSKRSRKRVGSGSAPRVSKRAREAAVTQAKTWALGADGTFYSPTDAKPKPLPRRLDSFVPSIGGPLLPSALPPHDTRVLRSVFVDIARRWMPLDSTDQATYRQVHWVTSPAGFARRFELILDEHILVAENTGDRRRLGALRDISYAVCHESGPKGTFQRFLSFLQSATENEAPSHIHSRSPEEIAYLLGVTHGWKGRKQAQDAAILAYIHSGLPHFRPSKRPKCVRIGIGIIEDVSRCREEHDQASPRCRQSRSGSGSSGKSDNAVQHRGHREYRRANGHPEGKSDNAVQHRIGSIGGQTDIRRTNPIANGCHRAVLHILGENVAAESIGNP